MLHRSSFLAWQAFATALPADEKEAEKLFVEGFLNQAELLTVACEAVLVRAIHERVSMVLEGVHVHPDLLARIPRDSDAVVVPVMLGVLSTSELKRRIQGRGKRVPGRRAKRYLEHFDAIWRLQSFLLGEADRTGMPIVANEDVEVVAAEVLGLILAELSKHFTGTPERAFA